MKKIAGMLAASMMIFPSISYSADIAPQADLEERMAPKSLFFGGLVEVWAGHRRIHSTDDPDYFSQGLYGANALINIPLFSGFSAQIDIQSEMYPVSSQYVDKEAPAGANMIGGHLSYRDPSLGLLGVFGGYGTASAYDENDSVGHQFGVEAQIYLDKFTLYGQYGVADFSVDDIRPEEATGGFWRVVGRYFVTDDFLIEAEYSVGESDKYIDGNDAGEFTNWGIKGKFKIPSEYTANIPMYFTAAYRHEFYDATTENDTAGAESWMLGLTFIVGGNGAVTLKDNDRYGATLDSPLIMPRAASWIEALD